MRVRRSSYCIVKLIFADLRPQNSPDLNPVHYQIWGVMQDQVYQMSAEDVAALRQRLIDALCKAQWTVLLMNFIRGYQVCVDEQEVKVI